MLQGTPTSSDHSVFQGQGQGQGLAYGTLMPLPFASLSLDVDFSLHDSHRDKNRAHSPSAFFYSHLIYALGNMTGGCSVM